MCRWVDDFAPLTYTNIFELVYEKIILQETDTDPRRPQMRELDIIKKPGEQIGLRLFLDER